MSRLAPEMLTETGELLQEIKEIRRAICTRITFTFEDLMRDVLRGMTKDEVKMTCVIAGVYTRGRGNHRKPFAVHVDSLPSIRAAAAVVLARRNSSTPPGPASSAV